MTESQIAALSALAAEAYMRAYRLRQLSMQNANVDYEVGKTNAVAYALAQAQTREARAQLQAAIESYGPGAKA